MTGKLAKAIARAAASLFEEEGIAVIPLDPDHKPPATPLKPEGEQLQIDKRGIEKCVKHLLWEARNLPFVQRGQGAVVVGRRDDDSIVARLCSQEVLHGS